MFVSLLGLKLHVPTFNVSVREGRSFYLDFGVKRWQTVTVAKVQFDEVGEKSKK